MGSLKSAFKFLSIPAIILIGSLSLIGYMAWKECKIKSMLIEEALQGNQTAIAILRKYEKPWRLEKSVLEEALKDNPYALQILGVN